MSEPEIYLHGGRRCALRESRNLEDWWVGTSPRNGEDAQVEGPWVDWVVLAKAILERDASLEAGRAAS